MSYWGTVMDVKNTQQSGRHLMPAIMEETATKDAGRICFSFPRSLDMKDGFYDLSFRTFSNAINKTARFVEREVGRSSMFETVLYIGHPDVRYYVVVMALMKTGHKVLISSSQTDLATQMDLIKKTDCSILLYTSGFDVSGVLEATRMESLCMPELAYLLDDSLPCEPFPFTKTFEQAKNHPCMVTQSSDSDGPSTPIIWTHWQLATLDVQRKAPEVDFRPLISASTNESSNRCYMGLPISHGTGLTSALFEALYNNTTVVLGPLEVPSANTIDQIIEYGRIDAAVLLPTTLEDIASSPSTLAKLAQLKFISHTGGSSSSSAYRTTSPSFCQLPSPSPQGTPSRLSSPSTP